MDHAEVSQVLGINTKDDDYLSKVEKDKNIERR